jgi:hypothetical protein
MGLTIAPGLPPLLFSLSLSATTTTGQVWITIPHGFVFLFTIVLCHLLHGWEWGSPVWKGLQHRRRGRVNGVFINLLLNHGVRGLQGIYFFASAQVANAGCMCSVIVYFLHCIYVCDCDSRHESLIMLSHSVMVRRSHLLARCYLGTMCMCTTPSYVIALPQLSSIPTLSCSSTLSRQGWKVDSTAQSWWTMLAISLGYDSAFVTDSNWILLN